MKLITRDTDYALRAVCYIAKTKNKLVTASELVDKLEIPRPFLRKILQTLSKAGILRSSKGKNGGFVLIVPPKKIMLMDLINIFQGVIKLNECFFKKELCPKKDECSLRKIISGLEKDMFNKLKKISLFTLIKG